MILQPGKVGDVLLQSREILLNLKEWLLLVEGRYVTENVEYRQNRQNRDLSRDLDRATTLFGK